MDSLFAGGQSWSDNLSGIESSFDGGGGYTPAPPAPAVTAGNGVGFAGTLGQLFQAGAQLGHSVGEVVSSFHTPRNTIVYQPLTAAPAAQQSAGFKIDSGVLILVALAGVVLLVMHK